MDDILDSLGTVLDPTSDGTGSLLLQNPTTTTTPTTSSNSSGSFLSGLLGLVNPLSTDATGLLNAVNKTPATTTTTAAVTTSSSLIMWVVLGGLGLVAVLFLARK